MNADKESSFAFLRAANDSHIAWLRLKQLLGPTRTPVEVIMINAVLLLIEKEIDFGMEKAEEYWKAFKKKPTATVPLNTSQK